MNTESLVNSRSSKLAQAVCYFLFPALFLFLADQAWMFITIGETPFLMVFVLYVIIFSVLGFIGAGTAGLLALIRDDAFALRILLYAGAAYTLVLAVLRIVTKVEFLLVIMSLALFIRTIILSRRDELTGSRRFYIFSCFFIINIFWAALFPERKIFDEPFNNWATAFFLALLAGLIFELRLSLAVSLKKDLASAAVLLAVVLLMGFAAGPETSSRGTMQAEGAGRSDGWMPLNRPNIILIVLDTVRRDRLSVYGHERRTTPRLEEFAEESVVYNHAVSVSPFTLPSHASMFTGLYPRSHGAHRFYRPGMGPKSRDYRHLGGEFTTLAEIMTEHGYRCGGVSANHGYAGRKVNMDQGFEYFWDRENPHFLRLRIFDLVYRTTKAFQIHFPPRYYLMHMKRTPDAARVNMVALNWIDGMEEGKPFFLFLNYMEAHAPLYPPEEFINAFPGYRRDVAVRDDEEIWLDMVRRNIHMSDRESGHFYSQYDASLLYLDEQLGNLFEGLKRREVYEDALVIVTSDHGEFLGEHDLIGHGKDLYAEVIDIPLIIRHPGGGQTGTDSSHVENRALFDFILREAGARNSAPGNIETAIAEVYWRYPFEDDQEIMRYRRTRRAVLFEKFKFISSSDGRDELYDLENDPRESINLIKETPDKALEGRGLIRKFMDTHAGFDGETDDIHTHTEEDMEMLRDLGYVR